MTSAASVLNSRLREAVPATRLSQNHGVQHPEAPIVGGCVAGRRVVMWARYLVPVACVAAPRAEVGAGGASG